MIIRHFYMGWQDFLKIERVAKAILKLRNQRKKAVQATALIPFFRKSSELCFIDVGSVLKRLCTLCTLRFCAEPPSQNNNSEGFERSLIFP